MPTPAATADVFEDLEETIRATARSFAARYNRELDNVTSEAFELFVIAHQQKFDPTRSPCFKKFVKSFVWNRLLDKTRHYAQRAARMPLDRAALSRGVADRRPRFDRDALEDRLTPEARELLGVVLDDPETPLDPKEARGWLRTKLAEMGWTAGQVTAAFRELRGAV